MASFAESIRKQFLIVSAMESPYSYEFSAFKNYKYGWEVEINDSGRVIVKTQAIQPSELSKSLNITAATLKSLTPSKPDTFLPDEFTKMNEAIKKLISRKYKIKKSELNIKWTNLIGPKGYTFIFDITEMTEQQLTLISHLLDASGFMPRPNKVSAYKFQ